MRYPTWGPPDGHGRAILPDHVAFTSREVTLPAARQVRRSEGASIFGPEVGLPKS